MALSIVKDTIELESVICDAQGNAFITKKINLKTGSKHNLVQVDTYVDAYPSQNVNAEVVISAYPTIPTDMPFETAQHPKRFVSAGDDSVMYKERLFLYQNSAQQLVKEQFPSAQISANNFNFFYTDHVYVNLAIYATPNETITNVTYSFMLVLNDRNVSNLEHSLGVMAENHDAMCALVMSNGRLRTVSQLEGNVFPMWRFGGIRPERMLADTFWLKLASRDDELMATTAIIRGAVQDARQMQAFDGAFGNRDFPDWIRMNLNQGITTGAIRPDPVPLRYADNGNTRMF